MVTLGNVCARYVGHQDKRQRHERACTAIAITLIMVVIVIEHVIVKVIVMNEWNSDRSRDRDCDYNCASA